MSFSNTLQKIFKSSGQGPEVNDSILSKDITIQNWSSTHNYPIGSLVKSNGGGASPKLYFAKQSSGPSESVGVQDPALDTGNTYWSVVTVDDNEVLHKHGNKEYIFSSKDFHKSVNCFDGVTLFRNSTSSSVDVDSQFSKGGHPNNKTFWNTSWVLADQDWVTFSAGEGSMKHRILEQRSGVDQNGVTFQQLMAYNNTADASDYCLLVVYNDHGTCWAEAPSTLDTRTKGTDILTRDWIPKDTRIVHTTGNETIDGTKTFNSTIEGNARGLMVTDFGSNYEMTASDFVGPRLGIFSVASFKADTNSVPTYNDGDFQLIKFYGGSSSYSQFICSSPRRNMLYFGHFWNGTWSGWNEILTSCQHLKLGMSTIFRDTDEGALFLCGGKSIDSSSYIDLRGQSNSTNSGLFSINAKKGTTVRALVGTYNGNLTWNGQTIQTTSDARLKTPLDSIPNEILDAWDDVNWGQFKFLDAVSEKGDSARNHLGLISQQVQSAFSKHGLDACDYGFICHDEWEDEYYEDTETNEKKLLKKAGELWMIRYTEALCMEAAYNRREVKRLKERLSRLEERLAS